MFVINWCVFFCGKCEGGVIKCIIYYSQEQIGKNIIKLNFFFLKQNSSFFSYHEEGAQNSLGNLLQKNVKPRLVYHCLI